jgi:hypothetical protein
MRCSLSLPRALSAAHALSGLDNAVSVHSRKQTMLIVISHALHFVALPRTPTYALLPRMSTPRFPAGYNVIGPAPFHSSLRACAKNTDDPKRDRTPAPFHHFRRHTVFILISNASLSDLEPPLGIMQMRIGLRHGNASTDYGEFS